MIFAECAVRKALVSVREEIHRSYSCNHPDQSDEGDDDCDGEDCILCWTDAAVDAALATPCCEGLSLEPLSVTIMTAKIRVLNAELRQAVDALRRIREAIGVSLTGAAAPVDFRAEIVKIDPVVAAYDAKRGK